MFLSRQIPAAVLTPAAETDWRLLLVNPWNELPEDYEVELATLANGLQVDARIYDDLSAMLTACREEGLSPIVCSAYRTEGKQRQLYTNKVARVRASGVPEEQVEAEAAKWVAPPGTSEHQMGLAVDISGEEANAWLAEHCWEYGFILRYTEEKAEITGITNEPWHFRYVGREISMDMKDSGLCLEEYLGAA